MAVWCLWFAKFRIEEYILGFKLDSFKESEELPAPEFLFNYTLDDQVCNWKAVTTRILPPSCLPQELQSLTSFAHEVTGTMGLIPAAIYAGAFLTVAQCWQIVRICNCKVPAKGAGSGAGGNLVKVDVARSLIEHFWANESAPKKEEMLSGIMGKVRLKDPTILSILKELDPENAQDKDFLKMKKVAREELDNLIRAEGRQEATERRPGPQQKPNPDEPPPAPPELTEMKKKVDSETKKEIL